MPTTLAMPVNIGLDESARRNIAEGLTKLLADTYTLYLKTLNFHWNVTGPQFASLHLMFEKQYQDLALANDTLAERVRALGMPVLASYQDFGRLTAIPEAVGNKILTSDTMIHQLVEGHEIVIRNIRQVLLQVQDAHDETTQNLLADRLEYHEKTAWMLRSLLG